MPETSAITVRGAVLPRESEAVWLDSPTFMTAAYALYRSQGFVDIAPYAENEIPEEFRPYLVFMERAAAR